MLTSGVVIADFDQGGRALILGILLFIFVSKINYFTEISNIMEKRCEGRSI